MVGVPGKYKGCETCRRRRVKCSNERPYCLKCVNSGRECEGYEREMVFITGTPAHRGRVASHPKKSTSASSSLSRQRLRPGESSTPEVTPEPDQGDRRPNVTSSPSSVTSLSPRTPAWEDYVALYNNGEESFALITALHVPQHAINMSSIQSPSPSAKSPTTFTMAPYQPCEMPSLLGGNILGLSARCMVHLARDNCSGSSSQSFCLFLYEITEEVPFQTDGQAPIGTIQAMGPRNFRSFPSHHFLSRVYRPMAAGVGLLNRRATFLAETEWATIPWETHPKSLMDRLLDMMVFLPSLLEKTDQLVPLPATLSRRQQAHNLLRSCLALERRFDEWLNMASQGTPDEPLAYWPEEVITSNTSLPFTHSFTFKNGTTGIMFIYYWMAQITFQRCIDGLYSISYQQVMDAYPDVWTEPPPVTLDSAARYLLMREMAANVCRGMGSALEATVQPDLLVAPMTVALDHYRDINATSQDGLLEILWLEHFRTRLVEKGQHLSLITQQKQWQEVARF